MAASKTHQNGKPKKTRKKSVETDTKAKKLSALDAAAQVLAETGQPLIRFRGKYPPLSPGSSD